MKKNLIFSVTAIVIASFGFSSVYGFAPQTIVQPDASESAADPAGVDAEAFEQSVSRGINFLLQKGQAEDGSFSRNLSCAVTSMATCALLRNGVPVEHEKISSALDYVLAHVHEDGGIYSEGEVNLRNYETSLAILCLAEANKDGQFDETIANAAEFLKGIQWDEGEGHARGSSSYGGTGYGRHKRPDVSNTAFFMEAMITAGVDPSSAEMQNALSFMSNGQNIRSAHNQMEFTENVARDDHGSMIYTPANGGETKVQPAESETGGLRGYASMTYAGLKSFLYAGLERDDIRVQAAVDWIQRHYDLDSNPGLGAQGLYYYYHVFAKALHVLGEQTLTDSDDVVHNWRAELVNELHERQQDDGSWANTESSRWYEDDRNLATSYALLALSYCKPELDRPEFDELLQNGDEADRQEVE